MIFTEIVNFCNPVPAVLRMRPDSEDRRYNSSIRYSCITGYTVGVDATNLTTRCGENHTWEGIPHWSYCPGTVPSGIGQWGNPELTLVALILTRLWRSMPTRNL